jgi:signal transduction histidine kinase
MQLNDAIRSPEIRQNKAAMEFLKRTQGQLQKWATSVDDNVGAFRKNEEYTDCIVEDVVKDTLRDLRYKAQRLSCSLHGSYEKSDGNNRVRIRRGSLREAVVCLVVNAFDAHAKRIEVSVRTSPQQNDSIVSQYAEIIVSDDGIGIPAEFKDNVGRIGWTSKPSSGHGMGVTIVMLLAKNMGGTFELRSCGRSVGEPRTVFAFTVPILNEGAQ